MALFTGDARSVTEGEDLFLAPLPTVLSASRLLQPVRDAPGAVTIIDRDTIRRSGARTLPELLRGVPGFQISYRSGYLPLVTYHGLADDAPKRLMVRIDGRSAYSPYLLGGIQWHLISLDLEDIERIEVFRGSNAASFGSQAVLGVIDIITRPAGDTPRLRLGAIHGSRGGQDYSVTLGARSTQSALRVTVAEERDNGLEPIADQYRRQRFDLRGDIELTDSQRLEVHGGAVRLSGGAGFAGNIQDPARKLEHDSSFAQLRWTAFRSPEESLSATIYRYEERLRDNYRVEPGGGFGTTVDFRSDIVRNDFELEHRFAPTDSSRIVWGLGLRNDVIRAPTFFSTRSVSLRNQRLFANLEWRANEYLLFNTGIMLERTGGGRTMPAPRFAANYHFAPNHTLRAAIGRGYRHPAPFERLGDLRFFDTTTGLLLLNAYQPSPALKPERFSVAELGYHMDLPEKGLRADLRIFRERVDRLVIVREGTSPLMPPPLLSQDSRQFVNGPAAVMKGMELEARWRPSANLQLGFAYTHLSIASPLIQARRSAPRDSASVTLAWSPAHGWSADVSHHRSSQTSWFSRSNDRLLGVSRRTDLRLAKRFEAAQYQGEVAVIVRNAGNGKGAYRPDWGLPRQTFATLSLEF